MIEIKFRYFGAFRNFSGKVQIPHLEFAHPLDVSELKALLAAEFRKQLGDGAADVLIEDSAVATEEDILPLSYRLEKSCTLMLLPPVCGG